MYVPAMPFGAVGEFEKQHLLGKRNRQDRGNLEVVLAAMFASLSFGVCYLALCFDIRFKSYYLALLVGPGLFSLMCLGLGALVVIRRRWGRPIRFLLLALLGLVAGSTAGVVFGERNWWLFTIYHFTYPQMGSYVNVDPGTDMGSSFMDAATIYFKESSYVLSKKAVAFHNGATYCVAPIVRQPVQLSLMEQPGSESVLDTATGFALPKSGTVDFWAVGTDCCGTTGTDKQFTCGDADSGIARSGIRVLDNNLRSMYLLAVQEWSASTGLPVKHPIFFTWVKDPVAEQDKFYDRACIWFWYGMVDTFIFGLVLFFFVQVVMFKFQIY
jgi:hypothetical protein